MIALVAASAIIAVAVGVRRLPGAPDIYLHLVWTWEAMRCLAAGDLPLWLPDLNAGFGSPGLRLAAPGSPIVAAALGLVLGSTGAGIRSAIALALVALLVAVRWRRRRWTAAAVALLPAIAYPLLGRAAVSEVVALPVAFVLLDRAARGRVRAVSDGPALAALWLLHAPTAVMAGGLIGVAALAHRRLRTIIQAVATGAVAAGLSAWHWMPLVDELGTVDARSALTGGMYTARTNLLGSASAHALDHALYLGWVATALLVALVVARAWRRYPVHVALAVLCTALASPLAAPLWGVASPLAWLQFPWRWLTPALLLAAPALARRRWPVALLLAVLPAMPAPAPVPDPGLGASTAWPTAGARVASAIAGNPFLVDAPQHRPPSFAELGTNLARFGDARALVGGRPGARVLEWTPLERTLAVDPPGPTVVELRLLAYPGWALTVDGARADARSGTGVVAVAVAGGEHTVRARWSGNPWSRVGQATAIVTALLLGWASWRRR